MEPHRGEVADRRQGDSGVLRADDAARHAACETATKNNEQYHYVATPGTNLLATMAGGKGRGLWAASNGRSFAVVGRNVYEVTTLPPALLGSMDENASGPVSMADNGVELMIVN